ncbi:MAG: hypothetical protein AAFP77_04020 [Bacteroidota bacterium]
MSSSYSPPVGRVPPYGPVHLTPYPASGLGTRTYTSSDTERASNALTYTYDLTAD